MALYWDWDDKCGEATMVRKIGNREPKEFTISLYEGNAFLIFIYEYTEDGKEMYNMQGFFVDKPHMKRCLGIDKKYKETYGNNMYDKPYNKITKIRINKAKCRHYKDIVTAFAEAFENIEIEIYTEKENVNDD